MATLPKAALYLLATLAALLAQQPPADNVLPPAKNPFDTPQDAAVGNRLFQTHCSYCHGAQGEGGRGADLTAGRFRFGDSDAELFTTIRNGIEGSEMGPARATNDEVWRIVAFVKRLSAVSAQPSAAGDPAAGKTIYETKGGCAACHRIGERGGNLGPELTDIGRRRGAKFLEESLLKPEADLPSNYRGVRVVAKTGETATGVRLNEDDISIQLRDTRDNLRSFLKDNVKEIRRDSPSLMPAYGATLTRKELEDLVAYLSSLRGAR
jgi:putative heme-binding domain-containing protein